MKPRLWFRQGWWYCGYLYPGASRLIGFFGETPRLAYNAWKFREMVGGQ